MDGLVHSGKAKKITMADVLAEVAEKHGLKPLQLKARVRRKGLTEARFEAFYRMRNELKVSYPQIAMFFGMDHTSVLHGVRMHEQKLEKAKNNG
jgi:chromosomal replication initiation ATPase DnaA